MQCNIFIAQYSYGNPLLLYVNIHLFQGFPRIIIWYWIWCRVCAGF